MRLAGRTDANQKEIVELWRKMGATVLILSSVGGKCPDCIVGIAGKNEMAEIKDGKKPLSAQKLTESQVKFHQEWRGSISIIRTVQDAMNLIYRMRSPI